MFRLVWKSLVFNVFFVCFWLICSFLFFGVVSTNVSCISRRLVHGQQQEQYYFRSCNRYLQNGQFTWEERTEASGPPGRGGSGMGGWARGEREDGGVCKVGRGEKEPVRWSRGKGEEERNGSVGGGGLGRKGSRRGIPGSKACRKHAAEGRGGGDSFEGKKGGKGAR